ncbi:MAG: DNA mismatch repair protein MutS [Candidatus Dormibacteraeota bacterium]|nr:DNA mismatch repair protein MutS [Candidatus Dormibacteraeota bacterium]
MAAAEPAAVGGPADKGSGGTDTPALRQYQLAKREHPDCLVLFRLGDFFEVFGQDAIQAAPILGVTLTSRAFGRRGRMPMCGVPQQSLAGYARKLLDAGLRVAVCDQTESARPGGKLVARRVVRILSAGTLVEESLLEPGRSQRCAGLYPVPEGLGMAVLDFSTGECWLSSMASERGRAALVDELIALEVAEVVVPEAVQGDPLDLAGLALVRKPTALFDGALGAHLLEPSGLRLVGSADGALAEAVLRALAGVVGYGAEAQLKVTSDLLRPRWRGMGEVMELDPATRRNLELVEPLAPGGRSLLSLIDRTRTAPGSRRLRSWLQAPVTHLGALAERQGAVLEVVGSESMRGGVRLALGDCRDLERLVARCVHGIAGPRDLSRLAGTLAQVPQLRQLLNGASSGLLQKIERQLSEAPPDLAARLTSALVDEPPVLARDGGYIRPGYDQTLDQILEASSAARLYISELEASERSRTGVRGLKVGYNRVFGYYIELRSAGLESVPPEYIRRQTLVGCERYVTAELKEQESIVLSGRDRALVREHELLAGLVAEVAVLASELGQVSSALSDLDAIQSLAEAGAEQGWVAPTVDGSRSLRLELSRHPLVEDALGPGRFVPNDIHMDGESERIWLITGPNMAGKSTFLRQVALICLLGQVGSLVPCRLAQWGMVDRIFTRVGAQDDLAGGRSTFMVEMSEMAQILARATPRSLLLLDEVGRGTSTYDGMSLAQAILEYLHDTPAVAARVLFSTHYHELTALDRLPGLRNYRAEVVEEGVGATAQVTFLHTIVPGGADRSYGLNVAQLAGLPPAVLTRAAAILADLESARPVAAEAWGGEQLALPLASAEPMVEELRQLSLDSMTPLEALQKLAEWQRSALSRDG